MARGHPVGYYKYRPSLSTQEVLWSRENSTLDIRVGLASDSGKLEKCLFPVREGLSGREASMQV